MMVERLWTSINNRNQIMSVAESLIPYFKTQKRGDDGTPARYVSVKNIEFDQGLIGDVNNIVVRVSLLSDAGDWTHDIIIREFKNPQDIDDEINDYNELERRTLRFPNVFPTPLIQIDHEKRRLVYEFNTGLPLSEINIDEDMMWFLVGRIFAMIQGDVVSSLNAEDMRELLEFLISSLPLADDDKENLRMLVEPHYHFLPNCLGGYVPCTVFDPQNIEFSQLQSGEITLDSIRNNTALAVTIPLKQTESKLLDRMSDLASLIYESTYREFLQSGKVDENLKKVIVFFKGYNNVSQEVGLPSLAELYPHGITLDLQILIMHWITKYRDKGAWNEDDLRFSFFFLLKKPFLQVSI